MLPLVAVLIFAILSMAALSVDLGLATTQQNRLQTAADTLAMAALREEADIRSRIARGQVTAETLGCPSADLDECLRTLVPDRVRGLTERILDAPDLDDPIAPAGDVDLSPGAVSVTQLEPCEGTVEPCWKVQVEQAIPLFFGQGSLLGFQGGSFRELREARDGGSILVGDGTPQRGALRTRGIPIGAIARAEARPVVRVGLPIPEQPDVLGRAPFALEIDEWGTLDRELELEVDGPELSLVGRSEPVGYRIEGDEGLSAGTELTPGSSDVPRPSDPYFAYVPLYEVDEQVVVGFGYARVARGSGNTLSVERLLEDARVAVGNASAAPRFLAGSTDAQIRAVFDDRARAGETLLLTPVLR